MKALDQLFKCGICHTPFNLARSLSKHAELHHSQIEPKISQKMLQNEVGKKDQKTEIIEQETAKDSKYEPISHKDVNKFPTIENEKMRQGERPSLLMSWGLRCDSSFLGANLTSR